MEIEALVKAGKMQRIKSAAVLKSNKSAPATGLKRSRTVSVNCGVLSVSHLIDTEDFTFWLAADAHLTLHAGDFHMAATHCVLITVYTIASIMRSRVTSTWVFHNCKICHRLENDSVDMKYAWW